MQAEQNLLAGIFAVQLKFVTSLELVDAGTRWAANQEQDICKILLEQGRITSRQAELLRQLTEQQIQSHNGDAAAALETFGGNAAVQESFAASIVYDRDTGAQNQREVRNLSEDEAAPKHILSNADELVNEHPGRYTIKGEQGRGAVGRVLIAYDKQIGREIALKELLPDSASNMAVSKGSPVNQSATLTGRFLREARITGQLEHPGIVPVYELGRREDGNTYYTMKLVRGDTLADRLRKCRNIGDRLKLLPHFVDLCQAIAYAHSRGVIHRDIKPSNVMIGEFGETVLLDWGLAKVKGQKDIGALKLAEEIKLLKQTGGTETVAGSPIGTPSYMSPEQADGRIDEIDERSDIWSLGSVLFEILTGRAPFTGVTAFEVITKVLNGTVAPVLTFQKDAPAELAAAAEKCLNRESRNRYASVESLAEDINAYLSGGLVSAYTYSTGLLLKRWATRNWAYLGAAAAVFVVLAVAIVILVSQNNVLVNRQVDLLVRSLNASASNVRQNRSDRWQTGMLLALQARRFELDKFGSVSSSTADNLREQVNDVTLGSTKLLEHATAFQDATFSPDGGKVATIGADRSIRVWDVDDLTAGPEVLTGHEFQQWIRFLPDGHSLVSIGNNGSVLVWQTDNLTADPKKISGNGTPMRDIRFSRDGSLLAFHVDDGGIYIWHIGKLTDVPKLLKGQEVSMTIEEFSRDGSRLAAVKDNKIYIWQTAEPETDPEVLKVHEDRIMHVTFSADGSRMASADFGGTVLVWQLEELSAQPQEFKGHDGAVVAVDFSTDGSFLASAGFDQTVRVWSVDDLNADAQVLKNQEPPWGVFFSPDGNLLVSAGTEGMVLVWQIDELNLEPMILKGHDGQTRIVAFSPDGKFLATTGADGIVNICPLNDLNTEPQVLGDHTVSVWLASFSPDGSLLATAGVDGTVHVSQVSALAAAPHVLKGHESYVLCLSFSPDGNLLASGGSDRKVRLWQVADLDAEPAVLIGHKSEVRTLSFSPDSKLLATAGREESGLVWQVNDLAAEPKILKEENTPVWSVNFSPDGRLLAAGSNSQNVQVWQVADLDTKPQVLEGFEGKSVGYNWFSPDGSLLAIGSGGKISVFQVDNLAAEPLVLETLGFYCGRPYFSPDGSLLTAFSTEAVLVWQVKDLNAEPQVISGHEGRLESVTFSPDSSLLATAGFDKVIRVWQIADQAADPQVLKGHTGAVLLTSFSPDGKLLASAARDATVRVWQLDIDTISTTIENECFRNLSWDEWQTYVGKSVPYERTIPALPLGERVPYEGAVAEDT